MMSHCSNFNQPIRHRDKNLSRIILISEAIGFFVVVWEFLMAGFNFDNGGRRCIRPILEKYQQGKSQYKIRSVSVFLFSQGESDGYTVETKEENFTISSYPLEQTEFLYGQKQGK